MKEAAHSKASSPEPTSTQAPTQATPTQTTVEELDALREILVGPEKRELDELRAQLEARKVEAEEVGRVLPEAIVRRSDQDGRLADALRPTIEGSIEGSVRRNPKVLADAIFPLMGPAIRRSIRQTLAGFLEGLNRSLEYSLSIRGLRWRLEAMRTGKPFSEVVLKYSLVFRVEQVFLIHRESALLLEHVHAPSVMSADPDMVSSMLGAIQDFMSDSFEADGEQRIEHVEFGDLVLELAQGPHAIVACVVRGLPRTSLRTKMEEVLEAVHEERGDELREFDGNVGPFVATRPLLEECFLEQRAESRRAFVRPGTVAVAVSILSATVLAVFWIIGALHEDHVWDRTVELIASEPGIVLLDSDRAGGRFELRGLLDPLARDPLEFISAAGLDPGLVDANFETYYSVAPELALRRSRQVLDPPSTVHVELEQGVLRIFGSATHDWVVRAKALIVALPGASKVEFDVDDLDLADTRELALAIEREVLAFLPDSAEFESKAKTEELAERMQTLYAAAQRARVSLSIVATGFSAPGESAGLERQRAEALQRVLQRLGRGRLWVVPAVGGVTEPVAPHMGRKATLDIRLVDQRALVEQGQ